MKSINKIIQKISSYKYIGIIIIFITSLIIMMPIFSMDLTQNNEAKLHMARILSIDSVLKDGVFPPIIDYSFMNGFGYALNLFYGPITTYIPIIFLNIFSTVGLAFKVFTFFTVFISGITMYNFLYTTTKRKSIAIIGAITYLSAPYKLSNIYSRNAIGEYTAFIFIPLVFEGLYNIFNENKKKFLLSIGIIGLILSHTISTVYVALFSVIYLLLNIDKLKNIKVWKSMLYNILISILVCAFFIIPLIEHKFLGDYTIYDTSAMHTNCKEVYLTTLGISDLFSSEFGNQEIRFSIGIVLGILFVLSIFCYKKINKEYKDIYLSFFIIAVISLVMSSKLFPWTIMPEIMGVIQFAWRNLGFFTFFASLVCGINAVIFAEKILKKEYLKDTFIFGIIISIFVFSALGVSRNWKFGYLENEKQFDEYILNTQRLYPYSINRDYLPLNALWNMEYMIKREDKSYIISGNANILSEEKDKLEDEIYLEKVENETTLELPYIYYLGYEVKVIYNSNENNTSETLETFESENGFLAVKVKECENAKISVCYKGTLLEKVGYIILLLGVILLIIYIKRGNKKTNAYSNKK